MDNQRITIDPDVLERCGEDLARVARRLAESAQRLRGARIGSDGFGRMNAWMVPPIQSVASRSTELARVTGEVCGALGVASKKATRDFETLEDAVLTTIKELDALLDEAAQP